jgi:SulP family sulfate permease
VVGGFLAGTGYFLVQGGFSAMADENISLARLTYLLQPQLLLRWLPGVVFAVLLLVILRRRSHFLVIPSMLAGSTVLFYLALLVTHTSIGQAHDMSLLLGPFSANGFWLTPDFGSFDQINWQVVVGQAGNIFTILLISVFSLLLNLSGLEVATQQDIDLNRELRLSGLGNILAAFWGSTPGYSSVSLSAIGAKFGSRSRLVGVIVTALCFFVLFFGTSLLNYIPKFILGGLLLFFGLAFLVEWLYDAWRRLDKRDYLVVVIIVFVMASVGVLEGIAIGLLFAVAAFVVDYSRIDVVKHVFSGEYFRSNVQRSRFQERMLTRQGGWLYILELQGYLFFGTANHLFEQVRQRLSEKDTSVPRYVILDFRRVLGIDISAVMSFQKMRQLAANTDSTLVFTSLLGRIQTQLEREFSTAQHVGKWQVFDELDQGLEWCEEQILKALEDASFIDKSRETDDVGSSDKPQSVIEQLSDYLLRQEVEKDYMLIRQGQAMQGLYFVEKGQVSIMQEVDGKSIRLRRLHEGTIIGEVSMYTDAIATASAVTTVPSVLYFISLDDLRKMEQEKPDIALVLHKFLGNLLSERLTHANKAFEAALE